MYSITLRQFGAIRNIYKYDIGRWFSCLLMADETLVLEPALDQQWVTVSLVSGLSVRHIQVTASPLMDITVCLVISRKSEIKVTRVLNTL